uniref:(northern house mosquito) hypothetical protein n=1 Tax=Culex pipiens TaxID=7175 RepID=A0A8D8I2W9_CULPI
MCQTRTIVRLKTEAIARRGRTTAHRTRRKLALLVVVVAVTANRLRIARLRRQRPAARVEVNRKASARGYSTPSRSSIRRRIVQRPAAWTAGNERWRLRMVVVLPPETILRSWSS